MSTIFSRRRVTSNPTVRMPHSSTVPPVPTASAAAAASQAFMRNQQSNASLSAAAAAAALRSHPRNPMPVSEVQTKRMARRASVSSGGSSHDPARPSSNLRRRGSAGSMTERTFRSPSPSRVTSPVRSSPVIDPDAPPMPTIPKDAPAIPPKSHKRVVGLDTEAKISSSPPRPPRGRGRSLERVIPGASSATAGASTITQAPEPGREGNQKSSVNFSRPMSPTNSPTFAAQLRPTTQGGWFSGPIGTDAQFRNIPFDRPKTAVGTTSSEGSKIQLDLQNAANKPTTPKKKKRPASVEDSHLATPTTASETTTTAITPSEPAKQLPTPEQPTIRAAIPSPGSTSADERSPANSSSESSPVRRQKKSDFSKTRTRPMLTKQPSTVHEQPELERQPEEAHSANTGRDIDATMGKSPNDGVPPAFSATQSTTTSSTPPQQHPAPSSEVQTVSDGPTPVVDRQERENHLSPSRIPHFSLVPIELESGKKYQPPPRSFSPVKPALKHSPSSSIRTASPVTIHPTGGGKRSPEESPTRSQSPPQKKSVRVSFDESPVTIIPSLETSKHAPPNSAKARVVEQPDFEEVYTPRPALPSFGSIRSRKTVEDTTPTVKPAESEPSSLSSSRTLVDQGLSKDHAIGGISTQDFAKQQSAEQVLAATESAQSVHANNLPLPPEVTSVEGTGYGSDSDESSYAKEQESIKSQINEEVKSTEESSISPIAPATEPVHEQSKPEQIETEVMKTTSQREPEVLPAITLHPASPGTETDEALFTMPGAFPAWESSTEVNTQGLVKQEVTDMQNEPPGSIEPSPISTLAPAIPAGPSTNHTTPNPDEDSDSDNSSIYSDAAEDPSELFASINAIVESLMETPKQSLSVTTDKVASAISPQTSPIQITHTGEEKGLPNAAEWDSATKYRQGLSEEKKPKIELAATNDNAAGEVEVLVEEMVTAQRPPTPPKPEKGKKTSIIQAEPEPVIEPAIHQAQAQSASSHDNAVAEQKQPALRKSMRTQSDQHNNAEDRYSIPKTLRQPKSGLSTSRYASHEPRSVPQKKRIHLAKTAPAPAPKSPVPVTPPLTRNPLPSVMQRRSSADSDSSFKRHRVSTSVGDSVSLRRTLRQTSMQSQPAAGFERVGTASRHAQSSPVSPPTPQMHTSLRQSVDSDAPNLDIKKKSKLSTLSPSRFSGFGRSGKDKTKTSTAAAIPSLQTTVISRFRSRFATDSDDEESPAQFTQVMRSRFTDSDDELDDLTSPIPTRMPKGLTPVRGIPRRAGDDDQASELLPGEDEPSDDGEPPPMPGNKEMEIATGLARERLAAKGIITNGTAQGTALTAGTLRSGETDGLSTSKHAPSTDVTSDQLPGRKSKWSLFALPGRKGDQKKRREWGSVSPLPSTSLGDARPESSRGSGPSSPLRGPKLQRRLPKVSEDSWPLPPPPTVGADDEARPNTSEGVVVGGEGDSGGTTVRLGDHPDMGKRRSTADDYQVKRLGKGIEPVFSQRAGKAKKFMGLRKTFGLRV